MGASSNRPCEHMGQPARRSRRALSGLMTPQTGPNDRVNVTFGENERKVLNEGAEPGERGRWRSSMSEVRDRRDSTASDLTGGATTPLTVVMAAQGYPDA